MLAQKDSLSRTIEHLNNATKHYRDSEIFETQIKISDQKAKIESKWDNPDINLDYGRLENSGNRGSSYAIGFEQKADLFGLKNLIKTLGKENIEMLRVEKEMTDAFRFNEETFHWLYLKVENDRFKFLRHFNDQLNLVLKYLNTKKFISHQGRATAFLIKNKAKHLFILESQTKAIVQNGMSYFNYRESVGRVKDLLKDLESTYWQEDAFVSEKFYHMINDDSLIKKESEIHEREINLQEKITKSLGKGDIAFRYEHFKENVPGGNTGHNIGLTYSIPLYSGASDYNLMSNFQKKYNELKHEKVIGLKRMRINQIKNEFTSILERKNSIQKLEQVKSEFAELKNLFIKGSIDISSFLDSIDVLKEQMNLISSLRIELLKLYTEAATINGTMVNLNNILGNK